MTIEEELERGRREGVGREENLPFLLQPAERAAAAVLLVHGFTASPWEMRRFGEELAAAGFVALGVRLPGHGSSAEDLSERRWEEWLEAVERGWRLLAAEGRRVYGVGQSTGALLLLALAAERPLSGLVLLSPYLRLRHRLAPLAGVLRFLRRFQRHEVRVELAPFYYDRRPVSGVYQLSRLARRVRRLLPRVTVPTLTLAARGDRTTRPQSAAELHERLGSRRKTFHLFGPEVPHVLTTPENPRWAETLQLTLGFLRSLEAQARR
jgi:carboxylesterase